MRDLRRGRMHASVGGMRHLVQSALTCCALVATAGCASLPPAHADDYLARVELLAVLQTLNADLLGHDSATLTLERWCADHRMAESPRVVARRGRETSRPIPDELRTLLKVGADEPIGFRHVQLICGAHVFSEADNWYVPSRLTAEMNQRLNTTDEPFGKVVQPLHFQRHTLSAELLWSPLPPGWEMPAPGPSPGGDQAALHVPDAVLRHRAILLDAAQAPFSIVVETYTNQVVDFRKWQAR